MELAHYWNARQKHRIIRELEGKIITVGGRDYAVQDGCIFSPEKYDLSTWQDYELKDILSQVREPHGR
jgi:hypothetical protein